MSAILRALLAALLVAASADDQLQLSVPINQVQLIDASPPESDPSGSDPSELAAARAAGKADPMMELLNWATKNHDPDRLKDLMEKYQAKNLTIKDYYGQDVFDALFVDEANVMRVAIRRVTDFENDTMSDDELESALYQLQEMVEQVDNAGNLHIMGGLVPLLDLSSGTSRSLEVRALALWTLGVASQNNAPVQADIFKVDGLARLIAIVPRDCARDNDETANRCCEKLIYALSALLRNHDESQAAADSLGFFDWLLDEGVQSTSSGIAKKSLSLLDTVLAQTGPTLLFLNGVASVSEKSAAERRSKLSKALIARVRSATGAEFSGITADGAEKALRLVHRLLSLRPFLFHDANFKTELNQASRAVVEACERLHGSDEFCEDLKSSAQQADAVLAAHDIPDEEL